MPEQPLTFPQGNNFNREVRLGLVLYGGVSLAVYIEGVAQEFFSAVRGRGVYGLLKAILGSDIVVDIVSGSSAGGINGVLLSYALANNVEFSAVAELWREHGDFAKLLRSPREATPPSLLRGGDYFQVQLEDALRKMLAKPCPEEPSASSVDAIDLFVTATDYNGQLSFVLDDLGTVLPVKDYRRVFALKHRARRASDLQQELVDVAERSEWLKALATVCRSTATFPGAFEPVEVPAYVRNGANGAPRAWHELLHDWSASKSDGKFVLLDGGILDNKPFTYTLRAIYRRTASREVDRKLFYVEPDPERLEKRDVNTQAKVPDFLDVVTGALSSLPSYEGVADDFASLAEHNARVREYEALLERVRQEALKGARVGASEKRFRVELHRLARLRTFTQDFVTSVLEARQLDARTRAADAEGSGRELRDTVVKALSADLDPTDAQNLLDSYDVSFPVRRLFHVTYRLYDAIYSPGGDPDSAKARTLLHALNRHLTVYKLLQASYERAVARLATSSDFEARAREGTQALRAFLWAELKRALTPTPALAKWLAQRERPLPGGDWSGFLTDAELRRRFEGAADPAYDGEWLLPCLRQAEEATLDRFDRELGPEGTKAAADYEHFEAIDELTYPFESLAHLEEKDPVATVRISPNDATVGLCGRSAHEKITGETLGHFGAFMKRSWRSNDMLWGRLDAVTLLIQELLSPAALERARASGALKRLREFLNGDATRVVQKLFPCSPGDHAKLAAWLERLVTLERFDGEKEMIETLITAAQRELVPREVATVVEDAITQSSEWEGQGAVPRGSLDAAVAGWSASALARKVTGRPDAGTPTPEDLVDHFRDNYRVGKESVGRNIPALVLLKLGAQAGLVLLRVLQPGLRLRLPDFVLKVVSPVLTVLRFLVSFFYLFALGGSIRPVRNAMRVASWLLLLLGIFWPSSIWVELQKDQLPQVSLLWGAVFIVGPVLYLLLDAILAFGPTLSRVAQLLALGAVVVTGYGFSQSKYDWLRTAVESIREYAAGNKVWLLVPMALLAAAWLLGRISRSLGQREHRVGRA